MAKRLRVQELRAELAKRGLDTSGPKASLVERLDAALGGSQDPISGGGDSSVTDIGRKRGRGSQDGNSNDKLQAIEEFRQMGIGKLREQAKLRRISAAGTKKEVLEKLCRALEESGDVKKEEEQTVALQDGGSEKEEKMLTATKKELGDNQDPISGDGDSAAIEIGRKRGRESQDGNSNDKLQAIEEFRKMGIGKLREQARLRGISAAGTKKELLEKLCRALEESGGVKKEEEQIVALQDGGSEKEKMLTATKKELGDNQDPISGDGDSAATEIGRKRGRQSQDGNSNDKLQSIEEFRQMGIGKLREQATLRGISAAGTKKVLLEKLCRALEESGDVKKEEEQTVSLQDGGSEKEKMLTAPKKELGDNQDSISGDGDSAATEIGRKRGRESQDGNSNDKLQVIEEFQKMGIGKLREQATRWGISAAGTKKELLEKLCRALEESGGVKKEEEQTVTLQDCGSEKEKMVTATKKGGAVLDQWLPDHVKEHYHVLQQGNDIYDAMLNQTNVRDNNNKFYLIQCLESDDGSRYMFYCRWGRVGAKGQTKLEGPSTTPQAAISMFEAKFHDKTKNLWSSRNEFVSYPKSYTLLEMDYSKEENESTVKEKPISSNGAEHRETKLEPCVAKFISLIFNLSMMKQQMMEIGYNADKLPLGKLSRSTILKGYDALKRIADAIDQRDRTKLENLSSEFYSVIPHDFGFKKMRDFVIDTPVKLKQKLQMVEALGEIEVATKLLQDSLTIQEDPLYYHYGLLHCDLAPVEADSKEYSMISRYMKNTHGKTHSGYTADIVQIFKVEREGEVERFEKFSNMKNRMLLWHGSQLTNWTGILSQGLRIAPPEAPSTGYMFGKGVYFADMFSKSANYCCASRSSTSAVLVLCEVALGDMNELLQAKSDANKLPPGKLSTKGVGTTAPNPSKAQTLENGAVVPLGKAKEGKREGSLDYNEYIVYNVEQIRMRYIVQVNFDFKHNQK